MTRRDTRGKGKRERKFWKKTRMKNRVRRMDERRRRKTGETTSDRRR